MERKEQGFTIIELLVAMAILGLLIGLMIPGIGIVRRGARNTARRTSLQAIQAYIEDYYGNNRSYPNDIDEDLVDTQFTDISQCIEGDDMEPEQFGYYYMTSGNTFTLGACLEGGDYFEASASDD